jgi:hypothetical protein
VAEEVVKLYIIRSPNPTPLTPKETRLYRRNRDAREAGFPLTVRGQGVKHT